MPPPYTWQGDCSWAEQWYRYVWSLYSLAIIISCRRSQHARCLVPHADRLHPKLSLAFWSLLDPSHHAARLHVSPKDKFRRSSKGLGAADEYPLYSCLAWQGVACWIHVDKLCMWPMACGRYGAIHRKVRLPMSAAELILRCTIWLEPCSIIADHGLYLLVQPFSMHSQADHFFSLKKKRGLLKPCKARAACENLP